MNDQTLSMCENPARPLRISMRWPDGATHFLPAQGPGFIDTFWQMEGNEPKGVWRHRDGEITKIDTERPAITANSLARLIPRPAPFQREDRYIVIKRKDLQKLPDHLRHEIVNAIREANLPDRQCVVVESDWPEYEPTWVAIEQRMTGAAPAWNGEGLPPVGTVCEFSLNRGRVAWEVGTVLAHDGVFAVLKFKSEYHPRNIHAVRPIRTAEQIAEEERHQAIMSMIKDCPHATYGMLGDLYDAGYRKQVAP